MATADSKYDFEIEEEHIEEIKKLIVQIRNIRTNMNIHPSKKSELIFITEDSEFEKLLNSSKSWIEKLGFADNIKIEKMKAIFQKEQYLLLQMESLYIYLSRN